MSELTSPPAAAPERPAEAGAGAGTGRPRPRRRWGRARRSEALAGYGLILPDFVGLVLFLALPMALAIAFSFYKIDGFGQYTWIGLSNYHTLLHDSLLGQSAKVSAIYAAVFVPVVFCVGLALALLIKDAFPGRAFVRTALFTPYVISLVVVALIAQFMLADQRGVVNILLQDVGLGNVSWLGSPSLALMTLIMMSVWVFAGYYMLIFLAGLVDIPGELYEAARLDGADSLQCFRFITWPLLKRTSFFVVMTAVIAAVTGPQSFDLVSVATQGGPANSTTTIVFYIFHQATQFNNYGYASAIATVLMLALVVVAGAGFAVTRGGRFDVD